MVKRLGVSAIGALLVLVSLLAPASAATRSYLASDRAWDGSPLVTYAVALGPGRVAWSDNSRKGGAVWTRTVTRTSAGLALGPATQIGAGITRYLSVSGTRTAWIQLGTGAVFLRSNGATHLLRKATGPNRGPYGITLSGTRVLVSENPDGSDLLLDLRSGRSTDLTALGADPTYGPSLWGDYLGYGASDGSLWVRNLATGSTTPLAAAMPADSCCRSGEVEVAANHAAWARTWSYRAPDPRPDGDEAGIRDLLSGVATSETKFLQGVSADGWIHLAISSPDLNETVTLNPWDGSPAIAMPGRNQPFLATDGPYYVDAVNQHPGLWPQVSLLPRVVRVRPQFLGNLVASAGLIRTRSTASVIAVVDAVVHSCRVEVQTPAGALVRTLGCAASWQQGEIRAVWDGRSASGAYVPAGTYRWRIIAGNGTDTLLNSDGSTTPVSGSFVVR